ncbi:MAG: glycoside hydrolase family 15 protein [Myxococcaceae bacterium]|nr:glycoside hydrolase family 15 protein [Myxococcaceae bacterium]MCI0672381.1 glycoside hydrolase family 15 protein [Myxococcaceae bacterium]
MPLPIEDYALIGDCQTVALLGRNGSMDWLCLPRFDSDACFAALLGHPENGRWLLAPREAVRGLRRRYRPGSLILETDLVTSEGVARQVDFMTPRSDLPTVVRLVECVEGRVPFAFELIARFGYGRTVPWVRRVEGGYTLVAGPDALDLRTALSLQFEHSTARGDFTLHVGERAAFVLSWHASHLPAPSPALDPVAALETTQAFWADWQRHFHYEGDYREEVRSSLTLLKGLTYAPTGGMVAAPTASLPERVGGRRNWDYRYCWLRDATFTLYALMIGGFENEARAWRDWLQRAVAGDPSQLQALYGPAGEGRLPELELTWLPGYEGSSPVRIGNAAVSQLQLDIYGEVLDCMHQARLIGLPFDPAGWELERWLLHFLESAWDRPDEGLWEVRGPRRHFTHSKVMCWVALDRAVKAVERYGLDGPADRWRELRSRVHDQVCREAFDPQQNAFTQFYGGRALDAALLLMPLVGFLPPSDPRVRGTVAAIERELMEDGFVLRYRTSQVDDGLPPGEGVFLACTFWLADNLLLQGRVKEARALFERLLSLRNDVGLLAEQYDPARGRMLGNFPQAFSHVALVNTARNLARHGGPAEVRAAADMLDRA